MRNFTDGNVEIRIFSKKGVVLSVNVKSETHVSSSGGGGPVTNGEGYIRPPQIHSTIHKEQEIWIKTPKGIDECIRLKETNLPVLQGQRVTFLLAGKPTETTGWYTMLINHDAAKWYWIRNSSNIVDNVGAMPHPARKEDSGNSGCAIDLVTGMVKYVGWTIMLFGLAFMFFRGGSNAGTSNKHTLPNYQTGGFVVGAGVLLVFFSYLLSTPRNRARSEDEKATTAHNAKRTQMVAGLKAHLEKLASETIY